MGKYRNIVILLLLSLLGVSCVSSKKVIYLQDVEVNERIKTASEYKTVIHPDDLLSIIVSCDDFEAATPFNSPMIGLGREITNSQQGAQQGYIVDKEGYIDFPVLGRINCLLYTSPSPRDRG